jgi:hypothetical protein
VGKMIKLRLENHVRIALVAVRSLRKETLPRLSWRMVRLSQTVESVTLVMRSDVLHVHTLDNQLSKQATKYNSRMLVWLRHSKLSVKRSQ